MWLLLLVPGCRAAGAPTYAGAALFAGTAVGATAVNRAITGDCWATCSKGWHCNHESGLCEREQSPPGVKPIQRPPRDAGVAVDSGEPPTAADTDAAPIDAEPDVADAD